jgi:hypothetical protein
MLNILYFSHGSPLLFFLRCNADTMAFAKMCKMWAVCMFTMSYHFLLVDELRMLRGPYHQHWPQDPHNFLPWIQCTYPGLTEKAVGVVSLHEHHELTESARGVHEVSQTQKVRSAPTDVLYFCFNTHHRHCIAFKTSIKIWKIKIN